MGGQGSGSWYRWASKTTTGSQHRVDIRYLKKQGWLVPGWYGSLSWTCGGKSSGSINCRVTDSSVILSYRSRQNSGDWQYIEDHIPLTTTPCNYGGHRLWFVCPACRRRVAVLYGGKYFRCRYCHNLTYASQQETPPFRLLRKAQNIRERLGVGLSTDYQIFDSDKPKGMHWKTFYRLKDEAERAGCIAMKEAYRYFVGLN